MKHMKAKSIDWYQEHVKHEYIEVSISAVERLITKLVRGPGTNNGFPLCRNILVEIKIICSNNGSLVY
jgi:hypothetical protein